MADEQQSEVIPVGAIESRIYQIRGERVMLDSDLAELYGVETAALNRAVRRHLNRFPPDFMFSLTDAEWEILKCQTGISRSWGGRRTLPRAFTEQGIAMLSSVLNSPRAVQVNIGVMRAFVRLRQAVTGYDELRRRLDELEAEYDEQFRVVFDALRALTDRPVPPQRRIGFRGEVAS